MLSDLPEIRRPHRETVRVLAATYPFVQDPGLGSAGIYIGVTPHGGGFYFDPYELYRRQVLTHPALLVIGDMGSGKSSLVKTYLRRSRALFGRGIWCLDPKGENGPLMESISTAQAALQVTSAYQIPRLRLPQLRAAQAATKVSKISTIATQEVRWLKASCAGSVV